MGRRTQEWNKKEQSYGGWHKQQSSGWQQPEQRQHGGYRQRDSWQNGQNWEEAKPKFPSYSMMSGTGAGEGQWQARRRPANPARRVCSWHPAVCHGGSQSGDTGSQSPGGEGSDLGQMGQVPERVASDIREGARALQEGPATKPGGAEQVGRGSARCLRRPPKGLQQPGYHEEQASCTAKSGSLTGVAKRAGSLRRGTGCRDDGGDGGGTWGP